MDTKARVALIVTVMCLGAIVAWKISQRTTEPANAASNAGALEAGTIAQPEWFPATAPLAQQPAAAAPAVDLAPEAEIAEAQQAPGAGVLTAESLKGTHWKQDNIDVVFMADGRWQMNGRICAQWEIEGNRVKVFDDNGEIHYLDIAGDSLAFNGKKIGRVP